MVTLVVLVPLPVSCLGCAQHDRRKVATVPLLKDDSVTLARYVAAPGLVQIVLLRQG